MTKHHALLGAVLALPIALLVLATPPGARGAAVAAAAPVAVGLLVLEPVLRQRVSEGTAFWTIVLGAYGTGLYPLLAHSPDARRAVAFLLGAIGVRVLGRPPTPMRLLAFLLAVTASLPIAPVHLGGPGVARALFGSRGGLLFETPLLWCSLAGLALLAWRHGREAAPLVAVGLLPFVLAAIATGPLDVALPVLLLALATSLETACALVARRPAVSVALLAIVLALSNLAFMQQYCDTLRRDDTVSFPQVSEGNARLVARTVGSPNAWPANWIWSVRHRLPVERWDLLSGQRLDPAATVAIDIGDLEQDAALLLDGWSVRHACGSAICREVEGRAEMVVPLERAALADLHVLVVGDGALRVSVNGHVVGTIDVHGEFFDRAAGPCAWQRGVNRVVFESLSGTQLVDGLRIRRSGER